MASFWKNTVLEPYRLFFPVGVAYLLWGSLLWLPQLWDPGAYPVLAHRYLMLNGFVASFIGGFLMTAVPKFSKTFSAKPFEVGLFFLIPPAGITLAYRELEGAMLLSSAPQALLLLIFLFSRIFHRKENPPYSFVFIFVGLFLWLFSSVLGAVTGAEVFSRLHYEGAVAAIILGVGSRLVPGILGHVEIVAAQRLSYERPVPILRTVPLAFFGLVFGFVGSYFLPDRPGSFLRALVVAYVAMRYWLLWKAPRERTALTWSIWVSSWCIIASFLLRALWQEGMIHAGHSFFITGIVLLCLLIATRVLQSHGPKQKELEDRRLLYVVTALIILAAATRVTAYLMPEHYLRHLAYSAVVLVAGVILWSVRYLRLVLVRSEL